MRNLDLISFSTHIVAFLKVQNLIKSSSPSNLCVLKGMILESNSMNAKKMPAFFPLVIISLLDSCMVTWKLPPDVAPGSDPSIDLPAFSSG